MIVRRNKKGLHKKFFFCYYKYKQTKNRYLESRNKVGSRRGTRGWKYKCWRHTFVFRFLPELISNSGVLYNQNNFISVWRYCQSSGASPC